MFITMILEKTVLQGNLHEKESSSEQLIGIVCKAKTPYLHKAPMKYQALGKEYRPLAEPIITSPKGDISRVVNLAMDKDPMET